MTIVPPSTEKWVSYAYNVPKERITFVKAGKTQRHNQATMDFRAKITFIQGINYFLLQAWGPSLDSSYGQTVAIHGKPHRMHGMFGPIGEQRFLVWHRAYLRLVASYTITYL
jgi:hypothetical protein